MSDDFRERLYTIDTRGNRKWVYPTVLSGRFRRFRTLLIIVLMVLYLMLPWITFENEQAVFLDIFHRRFVFFGNVFWATDSYFLFLLLGSLAFSLFFFTSLFGRIWCGWACPETVFLEFLFRPIEHWIEGGPVERRRLDSGPWGIEKILKKTFKIVLYAGLSWLLVSTALAYFIGRERLLAMMIQPPGLHFSLFSLTVVWTILLVFQFGWFREQFCTVLCPYARLQSVLLDSDSLTIGYDRSRGEPRGKKRVSEAGDCIDCGLCVRVCPTGIDIRNGLQLECIQCASCIDACDSVMRKVGRSTGLIRYATERTLSGGKLKLLRPRVLIYAAIVSTYLGAFGLLLLTRNLTEFQIIRATRELPFSLAESGLVTNHFHIHLTNKAKTPDAYFVYVQDRSDVSLTIPISPFPVEAESIVDIPLFLSSDKNSFDHGRLPISVKVIGKDGFVGTQQIVLLGPG